MAENGIVIVGAGLAGLSCALRLQERGVDCQILEKSECVGGRVRTYVVDGYRLDRGFQVLLTAYPKTQQTVDYAALELKSFFPGAQVRLKGRFHRMGDPTRRPADTLSTLLTPIGTITDKARILPLRQRVTSGRISDLLAKPEVTTEQRLREEGFSDKIIQQFFRPFLGGIFLEPNLVTSSRKFEFIMRMFSEGEAALPKFGMQAIPQQLANRLKPGVLRTGSAVKAVDADGVTLDNGIHLQARIVVLATDEPEAARLNNDQKSIRSGCVTCLYYAADRSPVRGRWLVLNGDTAGPINNLAVPTELHPTHAPPGQALISVTVLGVVDDEVELERRVRAQLLDWYGTQVESWRYLRTYSIPEALTLQAPPALSIIRKSTKITERLFACGDYLSITSIEGAVASGIRCADQILES